MTGEIWTYTYVGVPKYDGEGLVSYSVSETVPAGYTKTTDNGRDFTNTLTPITDEIVITADSDSKVYDGTALTDSGYTYTDGILVAGDVLTAVVEGTITNVGTAANVVTSYVVMRGTVDVTGNYTFGTSVDGVLAITARPVTLTSATDSKVYDGTALTNATVTVGGDGFASGEGADYTVTGSQLDVGSSDNSFTYTLTGGALAANYTITKTEGTLTVTPITDEIVITADSDSKVYDGTALTDSGYTYTDGILVAGDVLTAVVEGTITNVGTAANVVTSYVVMRGTVDVTGNYTFGTSVDGVLAITARPVTLTSATDSKVYDGTALTNATVTVGGDGFASGEGADYTVTGSQLDVGSSDNSFTYTLTGGALAANYTITKTEGTLTVTPITDEIVITADSDSKVYDGTALTDSGYTYTDGILVAGDVLTAVVEGTITNVGTAANVVTSYVVMRGTVDVTGNYTFGTSVDGVLAITARPVTLTSATDSKVYDGTALTNATVTVGGDGFASGEGADYTVTGSQLDVGSSDNSFTYTLTGGALAANYTITKTEGTLTVTPITDEIVITADSDSKVYDGTALTDSGYTYTDGILVAGDVLTAVVEGTITNVGTAANVVTSYVVMRGTVDVTGNYTFGTSVDGVLAITARPVTLTSATDSKVYDGTALTNATVTVGGDGFASGEGADYTVTGSQLDVGSSDNSFTYTLTGGALAANYTITKTEGTLTVTPITDEIVITADSDSKVYDGTALTDSGYTYTDGILVAGDVLTAVVEGTITNVGTAANVVTSYVVMRGTVDVTGNYTFGTSVDGVLAITARPVTLTSATDSKVYDGTALTNATVTVGGDGFASGEGADYTVTGSQLDVGSSDNSFTYTLTGGALAANYTITKTEGTLTVTPITDEIVITADSDSKVYDGTALTDSGYTYTDGILVAGDVLTAVVEGTITNVGTAANVVTSYVVMRGTVDVTGNYTFGTSVDGVLAITARPVTLTSATDSKVYDGTALTNATVTVGGDGFASGEGADYTVTGSQLDVGSSDNSFTYTLTGGALAANYTITKTEGTLTVTPITDEIVITADSDSKVYDGTALTDSGYTYTDGILVAGDVLTAVVEGTITNVGTAANVVTSYVVMRGTVDVTGNYTFGTSVDGVLAITARPVTLTSATDSKVYDGTALTNATVTVGGDGFASGEGADYTVTGSQLDVGSSDNSFTYTLTGGALAANYTITKTEGTLTVTPITDEIVITADSDSKVYDGTALTDSGYTYTDGILVAGDVLTAVVEGTITNVGTAANVVTSYVVMRGTVDVTGNYTFGTSVDGVLAITARPVTLTSATDSKVYDGTALTNATVTVGGDGFASGEGADYTVTGSQLDVGSSDNSFTYTLTGGALAANYTITKTEGTLTVTPITDEIVITADSDSKVYDGTALTDSGYTYTDGILVAGDVLTAVVEGTITNVGTAANVVTSYVVMRGTVDVTGNYTFGTSVDGVLAITARPVTLTSATDSKVYDGTALTNATVTVGGDGFASGEGADYTVTGSQLDVGSSDNSFTYTLTGGALAANYTITKTEGTLTVTPITDEIVITADSDSKVYDGTALTDSGYTYTDGILVAGDVLTAVVEGTITNVGTAANVVTSYVVMRGTVDVTGNYTFGTSVDGVLAITARPVTLTSATDSKVYDGTALTNATVTVGGDGFASGEGADYTVTGSQLDVGSSDNSFTYTLTGGALAANYTITKTEGTLTVTPITDEIVITADSDSKVYDGTALTDSGYTYTDGILVAGDVLTAVVEGTITNVGTAANVVTSYVVMRGTVDVTGNYTFGTSVDGVLAITQDPAVALIKTSDPTNVSAPQEVTYTYTITNTGNVPLTDLSVTDNRIAGAITPLLTTLNPGTSTTAVATYIITQAMIDAGIDIVNIATVTGLAPDNETQVEATDSATVSIDQIPNISIEKTANVASYDTLGDVITYTVKVKNTGNVTLTDVLLTDTLVDVTTVIPIEDKATDGRLEVDETWTYTYVYIVDQDDIDADQVNNTATASSAIKGLSVSDSVTVIAYKATGSLTLSGSKTLTGRAMVADEFTFEVYEGVEATGTPLFTTTNIAADASITAPFTFPDINYIFADIGSKTYTVVEKQGTQAGIIYATNTYSVSVEISDNGDRTLGVEVTSENASALDFANQYEAIGAFDVDATLNPTKALANRALADQEFEFILRQGDTILQTVRNTADGNIPFAALNYTQADIGQTYDYSVTETAGTEAGMTYDAMILTFSVTVSDLGNGELSATLAGTPEDTEFNNSAPLTRYTIYYYYRLSPDDPYDINGDYTYVSPLVAAGTQAGGFADRSENGFWQLVGTDGNRRVLVADETANVVRIYYQRAQVPLGGGAVINVGDASE